MRWKILWGGGMTNFVPKDFRLVDRKTVENTKLAILAMPEGSLAYSTGAMLSVLQSYALAIHALELGDPAFTQRILDTYEAVKVETPPPIAGAK